MTLWNAYSFTATGNPVPNVAPPALRVYGEATAAQLALSQNAFASFVMRSRLSVVPNPQEVGRLPDGTNYRITVVGPQTTMEIWPVGDDNLRPSGIAITLEHVDGRVIDGHHTDGVRTLYLLTPEVKRNTRRSTGKWKVRNPQFLAGGKAVNASADGKFYYAGVRGGSDISIPLVRPGGLGVNGVAYANDAPGLNTPIHRHSSALCSSRNNPIPWLYKKNGRSLGMQLVVRLELVPTTRYFLDLYAGPPSPGGGPIGELVDTFNVPAGRTINGNSITFSGDGTTARALGSSADGITFLRLDFTPTSVSMATERTVPQSRIKGFRYNLSGRAEVTGLPATVGYREQAWTIFGEGRASTEYGSTDPVDIAINAPISASTQRYDGEIDYISYRADSHLFDRRGMPDDDAAERPMGHASGYADSYSSMEVIGEPVPMTLMLERKSTQTSRALNTMDGPSGRFVVYEEKDEMNMHSISTVIGGSNGGGESLLFEVSGEGHAYSDDGGGPAPIFEDKELDFSAFYYTRNARRMEWTWKVMPETSAGYGREITMDEITRTVEFRVVCKGRTLLSFVPHLSDFHRCVAFLASDPMTGALLVNVQEVHTTTRIPRRSWIFLADDEGGKLLSDVMKDLPGGSGIKAVSNASIFSV